MGQISAHLLSHRIDSFSGKGSRMNMMSNIIGDLGPKLFTLQFQLGNIEILNLLGMMYDRDNGISFWVVVGLNNKFL